MIISLKKEKLIKPSIIKIFRIDKQKNKIYNLVCKAIDEDVKSLFFIEKLWVVQTVKNSYLRITSNVT